MIVITCNYCNKEVEKTRKKYKFCSSECAKLFRKINSHSIVECTNCNIEFEKCNSEINRSNNHFCSRSCSASYFNKLNPKRKLLEKFCIKCNVKIERKNYKMDKTLCNTCSKSYEARYIDYNTMTLENFLCDSPYKCAKFNRVREISRRTYLNSEKENKCLICGYNKHIDICHIKPISSYSKDTVLSEINSLDNLVALCRNCHWEFDHNLMEEKNREKILESTGSQFCDPVD